MARDFKAYAEVIPADGNLAVSEYLQALRENGQAPQRWLDAKHAGEIELYRDENTGLVRVRVPAPATNSGGA